MVTEVLMPKLGLTMTEGTIEEWKCKEGDTVKKGDILFSVATDKLTNDVECDTDGVLLKIAVAAGETGACKSVVAWIGELGDTIADTKTHEVEKPPAPAENTVGIQQQTRPAGAYVPATPLAKKLAKEKGYPLAAITGTGPNGSIVARDVEGFVSGAKTSPMAARLATEYGIDVNRLDVNGRVMKADVLAAVQGSAATAASPAPEETEGNDLPPVKVNPLRRSIAANMSLSWSTSPRVTYTHPVDATAMRELRIRLKDDLQKAGIRLTYNHILMKVVAKALMEFPDVNASFADNMLTRHKHANIGLAVAKDDGLIVPNVKCADTKSIQEIAQETEALIEAGRSGKLRMEDMTGGTFTISSLGPYGITSFSPIINQPELAILGICDIVETPVVRNGEIVIRPMMNLSLTADHRVIDGVMASKFLKRVVDLLEEPYLLLV